MINPTSDPYKCYGFKWQECRSHKFDEPETETEVVSEPVRIELHDSILKQFNQLSEEELEFSFGKFKPVQSLNPYMTKLRISFIIQNFGRFSTIFDDSRRFLIIWNHLETV